MCRYLKICLWVTAAIPSFFKKWLLSSDAVIEKMNLANGRIWQLVDHINLDIGYYSIYLKVASLFSLFSFMLCLKYHLLSTEYCGEIQFCKALLGITVQ